MVEPTTEPQDSDAAWLRCEANNTADTKRAETLQRIAARLEAPNLDALVEALKDIASIDEAFVRANGTYAAFDKIVARARAALQVIHEKKG